MKMHLAVAASLLFGASIVSAAPINIAIDIDTTRTSGSATAGQISTEPGFESWDTTNVTTSGTTITKQGVTFELFGFAANNQSRWRSSGSDLLRDFVFNEGVQARAIGLRITGLEVGSYDMQSWHYDSDALVSSQLNWIQVEVRTQGVAGSTEVLVDKHPFGTAPAVFRFDVTEPGQVREIIFREDDDAIEGGDPDQNRARLNGFTLDTFIPEPAAASMLVVLGALCLRRRR